MLRSSDWMGSIRLLIALSYLNDLSSLKYLLIRNSRLSSIFPFSAVVMLPPI